MAQHHCRKQGNSNTLSPESTSTLHAWIVVMVASLFFFYEFIQMNVFNSISSSLMRDFAIDAAQLGYMSSAYFVANVVFLFFAGMLLDRCSTRRVILTSLGICILGTALFSLTHSFYLAFFFRFLTGIGSAFCFLSVIRLATRWFPASRMAMVTGFVLTSAMIGGFISQTPMEMLAHAVSWRTALQIDAGAGLFFLLLIALIVKDFPASHAKTHLHEQKEIHELGFLKSLGMAFLRLENWFGGLYVCFMNLPVGLLGGLWGVLYLSTTHDISKIHASEISSMLFIGTMIGSPIMGWLSDKIQMRRPPMIMGAIISLALVTAVLMMPNLTVEPLMLLFAAIGFFTSTQIISYPLVAENSLRVITAMSVSVVNISVQGGDAIFQPLFGYLLDKHMLSRAHVLSANFMPSDFTWALWLFPAGFILALLFVLLLPETHCKQKQ